MASSEFPNAGASVSTSSGSLLTYYRLVCWCVLCFYLVVAKLKELGAQLQITFSKGYINLQLPFAIDDNEMNYYLKEQGTF